MKRFMLLTLILVFAAPASTVWASDYEIVNLTENIYSGAVWPSLNDRGQVAYEVRMIWPQGGGGYTDVFLDGLPLCGQSLRYHSIQLSNSFFKVNISMNAANYVEKQSSGQASLNNKGQLAWIQHGRDERDVYLDGLNITGDIDGNAT